MARDPIADRMLDAIADFLKSKGAKVIVIGSPRVQKPPDGREFNYEFVVTYTGSPPKPATGETGAGKGG